MSIKQEKVNAINRSREFLRDLMDPKKTKRIPSEIRRAAYWCLRHYPYDWEIVIRPDFINPDQLKEFQLLAGTKDEGHQASSTGIAKKKTPMSRTRKPK